MENCKSLRNAVIYPISVLTGLMLACGHALSADISPGQKDGICRVSLARINANAPSDYRVMDRKKDTLIYTSAKGYLYQCEVFSDGMALTLSNVDWGRLKPTASINTQGKCSAIKLFDPGFGKTHELKYCAK